MANPTEARDKLSQATTISSAKSVLGFTKSLVAKVESLKGQAEIGLAIQNQAHLLQIEAQAKLGEMTKDLPKNRGTQNQLVGRDISGRPLLGRPEKGDTDPLTCEELGIPRQTAYYWPSQRGTANRR